MVFYMARHGVGTIIEIHKIMTGENPTRADLLDYHLITTTANQKR